MLFCNGKRVGSRPEPPSKDQASHGPEAGQEAGLAPQAGHEVGASSGQEASSAPEGLGGQEAGPAPEAGHEVVASPGQEASPAPEGLGHEAGPAPEVGPEVVASPGQEADPALEAGQQDVASPGSDGLGPCDSVSSLEEAGGGALALAEDEEAPAGQQVLRRVGKAVVEPSPLPQQRQQEQHAASQPGKSGHRAGCRAGTWMCRGCLWDKGLTLLQAATLTLVLSTALHGYFFPG